MSSTTSLRLQISDYARDLFESNDFYEMDLVGGRGRGGSHQLTLHALREMIRLPYFRGYFVRAIHGHIRDSLWQDFKDRIDEVSELNNINLLQYFHFNEDTMRATFLPNGNTIRSRGFKASTKSNTAHLKSIAGATHIYGEEFEEVEEEPYFKMRDSLRTIKSPVRIIRSWNPPPKGHWLLTNYYNLVESEVDGYYRMDPKRLAGHESIFGTYRDNVQNLDPHTVSQYERYEETSPKYYYTQICGLISDGGDKKVYYNWKPITYLDFLKLEGTYEAYGLDFGDTAPCCLQHIKYDAKTSSFYSHEGLYQSMRALTVKYKRELHEIRGEVTDNSIWGKHKGLMTYVFDRIGVPKNVIIFCDPAQKDIIIELREAGYLAVEANKGKKANINFINRAANFYTQESINTEHEYENYYLDTDINGNPIDGKPISGKDHAMHAREYGVAGIRDQLNLTL